MRHISEFMAFEPTPDDLVTVDHVVEIAFAYQRGEIGLESVKAQTTWKDRQTAIRVLKVKSEKKTALMELFDALIKDQGKYETKHGAFSQADLREHSVKIATNWKGDRVLVFPKYFMDGQPVYPPITVEPGEDRRKIEARMDAEYEEYRRKHRRGRWRSGGKRQRDDQGSSWPEA